jgi:hypothetical protein
MKARGATIQGALAVVALIAAYVTWQRPKEKVTGDVVILDVSKSELEKVRFSDKDRFIELFRAPGENGPILWVKQTVAPPAPMHNPHAPPPPDAGTPDPAEPPKVKEARANDRAEKLYERFAPLRGARALGTLAADKLKELGLAETSRKLEVTASGVTHTYKVGTSPLGVGTPYVQNEKDGNVYLLTGTVINELDPSSQQLIDRRLHAFRAAEVDAFTVKLGDKSREFVQSGAQVPQTTKIAPKETPDKPDEFVRNWHDKIWSRLIVTDVLSKGETPKNGEPQVKLRIDYFQRNKPKGWLELGTVDKEVFARSEQTANWVALHGGVEEMLTEAEKVVGK